MKLLSLPLSLLFAATPAMAISARLLPAEPGRVLLAQATAPADAPVAAPTTTSSSASLGIDRVPALTHFGIVAAVGVVTVPVGLLLASVVGNLSIDLVWSLLPAVLAMGFVAPTLATLAGWLYGNWKDPGRFGFWLAWAASVVINFAALVIGGFAGVSLGLPVGIIVFSLIDGLAISGASVGTMRFFQKKPTESTTLRSMVPAVSDTTFVPLAQVAF